MAKRLTPKQRAEVARVRRIIANGRENEDGPNGEHVPEPTTCGTCGRTWDDGRISELTPVPSGRCPFEYAHAHEPEPEHFAVLPGRVIAIDGKPAVYLAIRQDPRTQERGMAPADADALTRRIVALLNDAERTP